jgi:hypothetical protein
MNKTLPQSKKQIKNIQWHEDCISNLKSKIKLSESNIKACRERISSHEIDIAKQKKNSEKNFP